MTRTKTVRETAMIFNIQFDLIRLAPPPSSYASVTHFTVLSLFVRSSESSESTRPSSAPVFHENIGPFFLFS